MSCFDQRVNMAAIPGLYDMSLPRVARVRQALSDKRVDDIAGELSHGIDALSGIAEKVKGKKIAVTAGSRGISDYAAIMRSLLDKLKAMGAEPFIVPAMGSHGGATAEGQKKLLSAFGITEEAMNVPIKSSMETVQIGALADGTKLYCDKYAWESDGIVLFNRVKPHSVFKADLESGMVKIGVIGLGKHDGAVAMHRQGFSNFYKCIPEAGKIVLSLGKVLFGVGTVENAHEHVMSIDVVAPENMMEREKELLAVAKKSMALLPFENLDILFVDEIGKDISGSGMDPNVMGRHTAGGPFLYAPKIGCIAVTGLSKETMGNGLGIGAADIVTRDVVEQMILEPMYINHITAGAIRGAAIPLIAQDDEEALRIALYTVPAKPDGRGAFFVRVKSTLHLEEFEVSESMIPDLLARPEVFTILEEPRPLRFTDGKLNRI